MGNEISNPAVKQALSGHWLVKFAPFRTSWSEIVRRGTFTLRGVRSASASKNLSRMCLSDRVLYYHSQQERAVVGVMQVTREAYPDPTSADSRWLTCDFAPVTTLVHPVFLATLKADPRFAALGLIRQPRLAVMPVSESQFNGIMDLAAYAPSGHSKRKRPLSDRRKTFDTVRIIEGKA